VKLQPIKYKVSTVLSFKLTYFNLFVSVGDPDPDDQHVFRPSGPDTLVRGADPDLAPDPSLFS
jgi:hypothetical protein